MKWHTPDRYCRLESVSCGQRNNQKNECTTQLQQAMEDSLIIQCDDFCQLPNFGQTGLKFIVEVSDLITTSKVECAEKATAKCQVLDCIVCQTL